MLCLICPFLSLFLGYDARAWGDCVPLALCFFRAARSEAVGERCVRLPSFAISDVRERGGEKETPLVARVHQELAASTSEPHFYAVPCSRDAASSLHGIQYRRRGEQIWRDRPWPMPSDFCTRFHLFLASLGLPHCRTPL